MRFLILIFWSLVCITESTGQPWLNRPYLRNRERANNPRPLNFYEIQNAFRKYEKRKMRELQHESEALATGGEDEGPFAGYAQFKRWENAMEPRVYPSGDISLPSTAATEFQKYLASDFYKGNTNRSLPTATWTALGPTGTVTNGDWGGAGRVNFIRFDPVNSNIMWTASPLGGLWKSVDGGINWTTNTDFLPIVGCSDIAIDPSNTQIMYLATGDGNGAGSQLTQSSIGILKSTDGGLTWPAASNTLNWNVSQVRSIYKLLIHPIHPDTVFAATSIGLFRTIDAGAHWISMQAGIFTDVEFKPAHPNVVYAVSGVQGNGTFYRSDNAGTSFNVVTDGLPASTDVARLEIGVTAADSNYVYVVAVKKNTSDFYGIYRSVDGGVHFTLRANAPNILFGSAGSQAWYNLAIGVSPIHKDTLLVGATNIWRSLNGGTTWTQHTKEDGGFIPFVHADHHAIEFQPGSDAIYYSGGDGGITKTSDYGVHWMHMNEGMQIGQLYKLGVSPLDPYRILTGHQDMATQTYHDNDWFIFTRNTGDGMECIYEHDNDSIRYLESYRGRVLVTFNNYPLYNLVCNTTGSGVNAAGNWITPIIMHPDHDSTLLIGKAQVFRTIDGGQTFMQVGDVSGGNTNLIALAYAESNPNYIYAAKSNRFFTSVNGTTFTDKTGTLPVAPVSITSIAVSNSNPKKVWVTFSGYSSANKVWFSADAGDTWSNYSTGLPNLPVNCITYQLASNDGLYVGTDIGIYFRDNSFNAWQSYFTGLPNVDVEEFDISYSIGKIRAATNGRGLWESDLAVPVPVLITWVGSVSSDWNNPANWSPNAVPTKYQNVTIPDVNAPNFDPIVNVPGLGCKHLTLLPGANVSVPAGNVFKTLEN